MREFKSAEETSIRLGLSISTVRNMLRGVRCETKLYRFIYADGLPVHKYKGKSRTGEVFREIEKFHEQRNGSPVGRICTICGKEFSSTGNRRCNSCNCEVENEYHAIEYRHYEGVKKWNHI